LTVGGLLADPTGEQTAFSNFSYSLYGLVAGGKGWAQVIVDHPNAKEGAEIYALAYQAFLRDPTGIVRGSVEMWRQYFTPGTTVHAFAFVKGDGAYDWYVQIACYALSALAILVSIARAVRPTSAVLLASAVGHVASIPFVPPVDAGLRAFAATMPVLALLVGAGIGVLTKRRLFLQPVPTYSGIGAPRPAAEASPRTAEWLGAVLAVSAMALPVAFLHTRRPATLPDLECPADTTAVFVRVSAGSYLRVGQNFQPSSPGRAAVEVAEGVLAHTAGRVELRNDLATFRAGTLLLNAYDLKSGRYVWLVAPENPPLPSSGIYGVCGHDSTNRLSRNYGVFFADRAERLDGTPSR
jgi:hypothetical protein